VLEKVQQRVTKLGVRIKEQELRWSSKNSWFDYIGDMATMVHGDWI